MTPRCRAPSAPPHSWGRLLVPLVPLVAFIAGVALFGASLGQPAAAKGADDYRLSSLRVFNRVVLLVKEQYVEPERIKPREMLVASLEAVEKRVPEVLVEEPEGDTIGVVVGDERRTFFLDDLTSLWELSFKLRDVFRFIETRVPGEVDRREIEYAAVNGMLSKLDPHSVLLEPRYSKEMKLSTKGEFGGLGIVISIRDGYLTVISPIDGTPAARAGILAQDRIVKIGEESTINMSLDEAVERLRGKPGTEVVIWITRKGIDEPKRVAIVRDIIKVDSVTHKLLENKLGYVKIKQFQGRTAEDVAAAVHAMRKEAGGQLAGLIVDLRNNPGGLLDQAVEVSNLFIDEGVLVVTQEGGPHGERKEIRATRRPDKIRVPVVVLVNGGSASASEIVAGAIKNRGRGLLVGDRTFGKGSVQQLYDFPDGSSLKLTIGQYLTPGDESIQSIGITPDVLVRPVLADDRESINLFPDQSTREEDLALHLLNGGSASRHKPSFELAFLDKTLDEAEVERRATSSEFHDDFEIRFAREVLKRAKGADRRALLEGARGAVEVAQAEEQVRIKEALAKFGVDWTGGSSAKAPALLTRIVAAEPVAAGDKLVITLEAQNAGSEPLHRVYGVSDATFSLLADREFLFGKLAPGEKRQWTTEVKIPKNIASRRDLMRVAFRDGEGKELGALDVPVTVEGLPRPRFSYALFIDDTEGGNGDGLLQVGESVHLVVSIRNAGPGLAEQPTALLKNLGGPELFIERGRQQLDPLAAGASATARFSFRVQQAADQAELRLQVFDGLMGDYLLERLRFPIRQEGKQAKPRRQVVQVSHDGAPVLAAADGGAPVLARAAAGSMLDAVAEVGDFVRVRIGDIVGYMASADVEGIRGRAAIDAKGVPKGLSFVYGRDPPRVTFLDAPKGHAIVTDKAMHKLRVLVEDDGLVHDVYIFNGDQKVFYDALRSKGPTRATVETDVKLEPGVNAITVVAREDDEFAQREVLTIFSTRGDPLKEKALVERH